MGLFDKFKNLVSRKKEVKDESVEVYDIDMLEVFLRDNDVRIAALTLPASKATKVARELADLGIKAFWNFAPVDLHLPEDVIVENVHLAESIMTLSYRIHSRK